MLHFLRDYGKVCELLKQSVPLLFHVVQKILKKNTFNRKTKRLGSFRNCMRKIFILPLSFKILLLF